MQFATTNLSRLSLLSCGLVILSIGFTGCSPFKFNSREKTADTGVTAPSTASCRVMIDSKRGESRVESVALTPSMTVEDVLHQSNATRAFSKIEVEILRQVPDSHQVVKLPVSYDSRNHRVPIEQNYAVLPNDQIIVRGSSSSPIDGLIDGLLR